MKQLTEMVNLIKKSPFTIGGSTFFSGLHFLKGNLKEYINFDVTNDEISKISAPFKRNFKPWSINRKKKFIENIILGYRTEIIFYKIDDKIFLLDGQHRMNALLDFINGKFSVFNNVFFEDLLKNNNKVVKTNNIIGFKIIKFDTLQEACQYYIDCNDFFTHSQEDIIVAKKFLHELNKKIVKTITFTLQIIIN